MYCENCGELLRTEVIRTGVGNITKCIFCGYIVLEEKKPQKKQYEYCTRDSCFECIYGFDDWCLRKKQQRRQA